MDFPLKLKQTQLNSKNNKVLTKSIVTGITNNTNTYTN
jgi:hypothetical protein